MNISFQFFSKTGNKRKLILKEIHCIVYRWCFSQCRLNVPLKSLPRRFVLLLYHMYAPIQSSSFMSLEFCFSQFALFWVSFLIKHTEIKVSIICINGLLDMTIIKQNKPQIQTALIRVGLNCHIKVT